MDVGSLYRLLATDCQTLKGVTIASQYKYGKICEVAKLFPYFSPSVHSPKSKTIKKGNSGRTLISIVESLLMLD